MRGLWFETAAPLPEPVPARNDVACFIGQVAPRESAGVPGALRRWLVAEGWWAGPGGRALRPGRLLDVPVPLSDWDSFDHLFAWERDYGRQAGQPVAGASYLGAAVRSFFAQGGRKCYVIAMGAPLAIARPVAEREQRLARLVPTAPLERARREHWHGIDHVLGLPEVAFVALPDLAELCAPAPLPPMPLELAPEVNEPVFGPCSRPAPGPAPQPRVLRLAAPRCDQQGLDIWGRTLRRALRRLHAWRRDIQLLAALPLMTEELAAQGEVLSELHRRRWLSGEWPDGASLASPRLQLVYPWLDAAYGGDLPQGLEPGEGALAGLLARNALSRGTWRNASGLALAGVRGLAPRLSRAAKLASEPQAPLEASPQAPLAERVALLEENRAGFALASDVTTSNDPLRRQAGIERSFALVLRAARRLGEELVFENNGEALWRRVEQRLSELLTGLLEAGALAGRRPGEAFRVRCDRSTMSQQDVDNGRVVAELWLRPAASIESLRVRLSLGDAGQVSLSRLGRVA